MDYKHILFEVKDNIGYVTVNRPNALNALNTEVLSELDHVFRHIEKSDEVKCAIVTGAGRAFVAGADIAQMSELNTTEGRDMTIQGQNVMELIENIDKPVIAAVNGFALGGGCELAMACDVRIASEKAKFGQPEVNLGIIPGYGGTSSDDSREARYRPASLQARAAQFPHALYLCQSCLVSPLWSTIG